MGPLLNTAWSQSRGCENSLVVAATAPNIPVGCVATAHGQIMNYYQHPYQGEGTSCGAYGFWSTCNITTNHALHQFDWDNMSQGGITDATFCTNGDDVAQLLYDVGCAFGMTYDFMWSGQSFAYPFYDALAVWISKLISSAKN